MCAKNFEIDEKRILITGGTGMIGSALVKVLLTESACKLILIVRDETLAKSKFAKWIDGDDRISFVKGDLGAGFVPPIEGRVDVIFHLASNTHPKAYAERPISTIAMNVMATQGLLEIAAKNLSCRFVYVSSVEVYGRNRGDEDRFDEKYCGYIDCNTLRAGYPESKRCGEALCQAYIKEKGVDVVIPRLARVYGPGLLRTDTKALSQFFWNAIEGKDIVLKSAGDQYFSYIHCDDAVQGLLTILQRGSSGEAYNVSDETSDIHLKDLAKLVARYAGTKVVFDLPDEIERVGFSTATTARLNSQKLKSLGWIPKYDIQSGIKATLDALRKGNQ